MKKILVIMGLVALLSGGIWAASTLGKICCGEPTAPCCPLK